MSGTIYLIVESEKDTQVVKAILKARNVAVNIKSLPPEDKFGGISRMVKNLRRHIETSLKSRKRNDCIVVLHDIDELAESNRRDYEIIRDTCKNYKEVVHIVVRDELESWILSDTGICKWLGIKAENWDEKKQPSKALNSRVQKKMSSDFTGETRLDVLQHLSGDTKSPSLLRALTHLENAPCLRD